MTEEEIERRIREAVAEERSRLRQFAVDWLGDTHRFVKALDNRAAHLDAREPKR